MVEAAILTPLIFMILFGIVQYGLLFSAQIVLRNAAAVAARAAVLDGANDTATCNAAKSALVPPLNEATLCGSCPCNSTVTIAHNTPVTGATRVTLTYSYPLIFSYIVPGNIGTSLNLTASTTMR